MGIGYSDVYYLAIDFSQDLYPFIMDVATLVFRLSSDSDLLIVLNYHYMDTIGVSGKKVHRLSHGLVTLNHALRLMLLQMKLSHRLCFYTYFCLFACFIFVD